MTSPTRLPPAVDALFVTDRPGAAAAVGTTASLEVARSAGKAGVSMIVIPAVARDNFETVAVLARAAPNASYALGIHPIYVPQARDEDLVYLRAAVERAMADPRFVAIGEIGLRGAGVTQGYLGAQAPTREAFVPAPAGTPTGTVFRTGDLGSAMGLENNWAARVVAQVGNFGEAWERNITPIGVPRGVNALWTRGGLQYAPPLR